jgi:hypothetical protein
VSEPRFMVKFKEPGNIEEVFAWDPSIDPPPPVTKKQALKYFDFVKTIADSGAKLEGKWLVAQVRIQDVKTGEVKLIGYPPLPRQKKVEKGTVKGPWAKKLPRRCPSSRSPASH